jgi:LPS export ABC transporter protein LptC
MDYYSSDVLRKEFNQEGNLLRSLIAQKMIHFETGDRTELHYPVMTISRHDGTPPWIIHSENAVTNGGSEIIFLNGNVLVTKQNTNGESLKIIARDLRYSPAQNYAESDDNVLMSKSDSELSGRGVQVQLEPHLNLKILANVRRKHDPR